jgi:hypothetical protein
MSAIDDIYLAIANLSLGGIKCRNLPDVQYLIEQADLPLRNLGPLSGEGNPVLIGTLQKVQWAIEDICLWAPIAASNEERYFQPMMDYVKVYLTALKAIMTPTDQSHILGFAFEMRPKLWGEAWYYAVVVTLTVEEYL